MFCSPTTIGLELVLPPFFVSPNNLKRLPGRLKMKEMHTALKVRTPQIRAKTSAINVPQSGCNQEQVCFIHNRNHITSPCKCESMSKRKVVSAALVMLNKSFPPLLELFLRSMGETSVHFVI